MQYMRMSANPQGQPVPTEENSSEIGSPKFSPSSRRLPLTRGAVWKLLQHTCNILKWASRYLWSDWKMLLGNIFYIAIVLTLARTAKMDSFGHQAFRTFDISDKSLSYKHAKSRISGNQNIIFTILWSWYICWLVNLSYHRKQEKFSKEITTKDFGISSRVRVGIYRGIWSCVFLLIAVSETNLLTNMTKTLVGVPKPHFLIECDPDLSLLPAGETYVNETLTITICKNKDTDYRRSFPSGHASQATVTAVYTLLELDRAKHFLWARPCQLIGVAYALSVCCLRINHFHHNWYDVLAGVVLGTAVAVWAYISKENHVKQSLCGKQKDNSDPSETDI